MVSPNQSIIEKTMANVKTITGCLVVKGSGMTTLKAFANLKEVNYDKSLCSDTDSAILISDNTLLRYLGMPNLNKITAGYSGMRLVFNPSICLFEEENSRLLATEKFVNFHVDICDPTRDYCRLDIEQGLFNETNLPSGCQVLEYVLMLNNTQPSDDLQDRLNTIEEIWGALIITNTQLTSISFPKLNKVYNTALQYPTILIKNNSMLQSVSFPAMKDIPYGGGTDGTTLLVLDNPQLIISSEMCRQFQAMGRVEISKIKAECANNVPNTSGDDDDDETSGRNSSGPSFSESEVTEEPERSSRMVTLASFTIIIILVACTLL